MRRSIVAGVIFSAALAAPATAAAGLVLGARDAPGLKPRPARAAAGQKALAAAFRLPAPRGKVQASHLGRADTEVWSLVYVLPTAKAAAGQLRRLRRALHGERRAPLGDEGYTAAKKRTVVAVWRRRNALGEILLTAKSPVRDAALAYAGVVDAHMDHALGLDVWHRTLEQVKPNGLVPRKTALALFALAYGPLPGTRAPPGRRGRIDDGTLAGQLILHYFPTLTRAQQAAALRVLGLSGARGAKAGSTDELPPCEGTVAPDAGLQALADKYAAIYGQQTKLGNRLNLEIVAGNTPLALTGESGAKAYADAFPIDDHCHPTNGAKWCRIRFSKLGQGTGAQHPDLYEFVVAHEVFHCFEYSIASPASITNEVTRRNWLLEGLADWAALTVKPLPYGVGDEYHAYLFNPSKPLFERMYDAAGFFGHLEDSTGDLWGRIPFILKQPNSPTTFTVSGADSSTFLNSWAASTWNEPDKGFEWTMTLPLALPKDVVPEPAFPILGDTTVQADAYTYARYEIDPKFVPSGRPILHLEICCYARLKNDELDTTSLLDAYFCLEGKCECPKGSEGSPPPAPPLGDSWTNLGLSGGHEATSGDVTYESLDRYCKRKQKPPPPPPGGGGGMGGGGGCGGCGGSNGDPHLHTFDDQFYDFQAAGEFVLARSRRDSLELQARQEPYPGRNYVSINTAFAMRVAGDRVGVYRGDPLVVRVNGRGFLSRRKPTRLPHGGSIRLISDQVAVTWPDGSLVRVIPVKPWGINVLFRPAPARLGALRGLLGNFNGHQGDDWVTRGGRRFTIVQLIGPNSFRIRYRLLGESWRVRPRESLFDYGRGQSTRTFTIHNFPKRLVTSKALQERQRRAALRACKRLHIKNPQILADCTLDVGATGDNRFATGSRGFEKTAGKFKIVRRGRVPPPPAGAETRWTLLSSGGNSNLVFASLQRDGAKVVAGYLSRNGAAEAATFTPSAKADATGIRRDPITSGWSTLGSPFLLPRAGGGLQVLLAGIHGGNGDPLNGTAIAARNPDGSFAAPVPVSTLGSAEVDGQGVLAPDGQPLWPSAWHGGLYLAHGATVPTISDLFPVANSLGVSTPALGRDGMGRYWLGYRSLGKTNATTGLYLLQINPSTLQPVGSPRLAPASGSIGNATVITQLACGAICRVVYLATPKRVVSWAYGEAKPTLVHAGARFDNLRAPSAAYAGGRLWTIWWNDRELRYEAALGNGAGAGGKVILLAHPPGFGFAGVVTTITEGNVLVAVVNWGVREVFSRYVNVVAPR